MSERKKFSRIKQKMQLISLKEHFGVDGYSNPAASIGMDSHLMAAGGFVRSGLSNEELTTAYLENWLAKRIIDVPSEDMTRNWYTLSTEKSQKELEKLRKLEATHSVKQEITNAIRWARLYGGAIAIMIVDNYVNEMDRPLDQELLYEGCFHGLLVFDRSRVEPSAELVNDLNDPDYGLPRYYTVEVDTSSVLRTPSPQGEGFSAGEGY